MILSLLSLLAFDAHADSPEIVVHADHLEIEEGRVIAENVEIAIGSGVLRAESMEADIEGDTITFENVILAPCPCEGRDPWSVQAASATVFLGESLRLRRAWVRIFDVPVVPVPAVSIPLGRRSGLLAPTVGYGPYGWLVAQPLYLTATDQGDVTVTPELRSARSARVLTEGRYALRGGGGLVSGAVGTDWETESARGALRWDHAHDRRGVFAASRGQVLGDRDYLRDYGDAFLERNLPFVESRALGGFGAFEFGSRAYQHGGLTDHPIASMAIRRGGLDGPLGLVHSAEIFSGWSVHGEVPWDTELAGGLLSARTSVSRPTWVGPVRITPAAAISGLSDTQAATGDTVLLGRGLAEIDARLGLWRDGDRAYERLEPGVRVAANPEIVAGVLDPSLRLPPWVVAPGFTWRRSGTGGLAELRAAVPIDERGLGGTVDARLDRGRWDAFAQANGRVTDRIDDLGDLVDLATAGLGFKSDPVELRASWIFADNAWLPQNPPDVRDLHQARWAMGVTPPFLAVLSVDGAVAHSLDDGTIQQRAVGLAYAHPTDCLIIGARGWWDADRVFPEVSIRADVRL